MTYGLHLLGRNMVFSFNYAAPMLALVGEALPRLLLSPLGLLQVGDHHQGGRGGLLVLVSCSTLSPPLLNHTTAQGAVPNLENCGINVTQGPV